ncbi:MAG: 4-(cytidine 5'-diphospho)-2-C-methyl-D-erythritol kinase [Verrucomicrobia bacterium]|nr:4-(cytidine 5'-diphospho)-2-C-methyl-D-erythritol kinase [Verrucomicrobiota bacterium]
MVLHLESHAKINLFLEVLGKRADGYHALRTLMLPISLADSLTFDLLDQPRIELDCSDPSLPVDDSNLVRRAAELLRVRHAPQLGARIRLEKRVPIGAGLGGGSSNGSAALVGLNRLWKLNLPDEALERLASEFGSDTAFFVRNRPALSEGRGEILTPVEFPIALPIFLLNFGFGSATAWAYKNLKLELRNEKLEIEGAKAKQTAIASAFTESILKSVSSTFNFELLISHSKSFFHNDLETPVFRKFPILRIAKEFLAAQPQVAGAMMCGSGSTMMAVLKTHPDGEGLRKAVVERFGPAVWTWTGRTLSSTA